MFLEIALVNLIFLLEGISHDIFLLCWLIMFSFLFREFIYSISFLV